MILIEPCCASKHFMLLRDAIGTHGRTRFEGYGDLSLTEMLPAMLTRYSETTMMIIAPSIPDQAADIIDEWLRKTWARMDGKGRLNVLSHLTIVADLSETASPTLSTWLTNNPYPNRLTLVNKPQDVTALLLPDMAVIGPMNFRYGEHFVCEVTTIADEVKEYWNESTKRAESVASTKDTSTKGTSSTKDTDDTKEPTTEEDTKEASSSEPINPIEPTLPIKAKSKKTPKMTKAKNDYELS